MTPAEQASPAPTASPNPAARAPDDLSAESSTPGRWYCVKLKPEPGLQPMSACYRSVDLCAHRAVEMRHHDGFDPGGCTQHTGTAACFRKVNSLEQYVIPVCRRTMGECHQFRLLELDRPRTAHEIFTDCEEVE